MRVADVEYTTGGARRFDVSQFHSTQMSLYALVKRQGRMQDIVVRLDEKDAPLDGIIVLSWIQSLLNAKAVPGFVRRYEVRDRQGERVYVNVYPVDQTTGAIREVSA